jgi:hypothetical protein
VDYDPSLLAPGKSVVISYKGRLAGGDMVLIYYGFESDSTPHSASMTRRSDGFWESPPLAIPAGANELDFEFNDGLGVFPDDWDFGGDGWALAVTPNGGVLPTTPVIEEVFTQTPGPTEPTSSLTVSWASFGATWFTVSRATSAGGPFTALGTTTFHMFIDTGLQAGATYFYQVSASNASGTTPSSAPLSGATLQADCSTVPVTFTIKNAHTIRGQDLYVVGDQVELGRWNPANGFRLTNTGSGPDAVWSGTIQLSSNIGFQYKYVKFNRATGQAMWEADPSWQSQNRGALTASCGAATVLNDGSFDF